MKQATMVHFQNDSCFIKNDKLAKARSSINEAILSSTLTNRGVQRTCTVSDLKAKWQPAKKETVINKKAPKEPWK